jgi:hypothetical protein
MLKEVIKRLKEEGKWQLFEAAFAEMKNEIIERMCSGKIKEIDDLKACNAQLELLDRCVNLDSFRGR